MSSKSSSKSRFPYILNSVLNQGFDSIQWCEGFRSSFTINDEEKFAQLLPLYFKSNNLSAFKRNLSHYGFRKAPTRRGCSIHKVSPFSTKAASVYYHESFKRDDMSALGSMRVVSSVKKEAAPPEAKTDEEGRRPGAQKPGARFKEGNQCAPISETRQFPTAPNIQTPEAGAPGPTCGFKTKSGFTPTTAATPSLTLEDPQDRSSLRISLCGNSAADSHKNVSLENLRAAAALLDRISGVSLCGEDFHLRDSHLRQSHLSHRDFSDLRWSMPRESSHLSHRDFSDLRCSRARESLHSLSGIDLSQEAYLRDQNSSDLFVEDDSVMGLYSAFLPPGGGVQH